MTVAGNQTECNPTGLTRRALVLCLVLSSLLVLPFFYLGEDRAVGCCGGEMPITHDSWMHFNQMQAFYRGLREGLLYPRWQADTDQGYGAPVLSFYPPGVYYLTSASYVLTGNWQRTWMLAYWVMMFVSGLAFFCYARAHLAANAALLALAFYLCLPYHLINQYQRGALAEQLSFIWVPLCLLYAERLLFTPALSPAARLSNLAGLAASYGAFLVSHPPTAYQFTLVFGVILGLQAVRAWREWWWVGLALAGGLCLAAAYFLPGLLEQHLIHASDVETTWPYHSTYVWDYVQTRFARTDVFWQRIDRIWLLNVGLLAIFGAGLLWRKTPLIPTAQRLVARWLGAGALAAFLMTRVSLPVGKWIPQIEIGVFSWRMLSLTTFCGALLAGLVWQRITETARSSWSSHAAWALVMMAFGVAIWATFALVIRPMWRIEAFAPNPQHFNFATLPLAAPREVPAMPEAEFASPPGLFKANNQIEIVNWQAESRELRYRAGQAVQLRIRTFYFPGWRAWLDGLPVTIQTGQWGEMLINAPAGTHTVQLKFTATLIRQFSNWLTVIAIFIFAFIQLYLFRWRRNDGTYS